MGGNKMPLWVSLGLSNFKTRKSLIYLALACLVFGLGFLPLPFLLDNWSWMDVLEWSGLMYPMALWYWLCLRWVDKNSSWEIIGSTADVNPE
jgi:hypothetical protein